MNTTTKHFDAIIFLVVVYFFWILTTPYYSNRLAFLGAIYFEKILAGVLIVAVISVGRFDKLFDSISLLTLALFAFMVVSDFMSIHLESEAAHSWRTTYWKKIVFFVIIALALRRPEHLHQTLKGLILVIFFYQLYSWFDFLRGGSYVYQQGMKRMCGTWSGPGFGAANGFGFLSCFALPFYLYWFRSSPKRRGKVLAGFGFVVSILSILFSGTRAALCVAAVYSTYTFRRQLLTPRIIVATVLGGLLAIPCLPAEIKHRYWDLMLNPSNTALDAADRKAIDSGIGRLTGMIAGFQLGLKNPIFGGGPGTSPAAASELLKKDTDSGTPMQLHNIYGQIAAEIGFVGLLIWSVLVATVLRTIVRIRPQLVGNSVGVASCDALLGGVLVMVAYGLFSHTLYDWCWLILFGSTVGLHTIHWEAEDDLLVPETVESPQMVRHPLDSWVP